MRKPDKVLDDGNEQWYWVEDVKDNDARAIVDSLNSLESGLKIGFLYETGESKSHKVGTVGIYKVVNRAEVKYFRDWMNKKPTKKQKEAAVKELKRLFPFALTDNSSTNY